MGKPSGNALQRYFEQSTDLLNSLVLVLPLLLIYQAGVLLTGGVTLNGADFVTVFLVNQWGIPGLLVFNGVLFVAGIVGIQVLKKERRFEPKIMIPVAIESTIYALLLGTVILTIMRYLPWIRPSLAATPALAAGQELGIVNGVFVSLGAGVMEELVFRLGLFTGLAFGLGKVLDKGPAVAAAVLISSVLFSLAHYLGPHESFQAFTFVYRLLAGALFCALFAARGFAVAVYTHAIYDIYVIVVGPLLARMGI